MTQLEKFDGGMDMIRYFRTMARDMIAGTDRCEAILFNEMGLNHVPREPGFPCWTHKDLQGYFGTPREAIEALEKQS